MSIVIQINQHLGTDIHNEIRKSGDRSDSNGITLLKMDSSCPFSYWKTNVILQMKCLDLWDVVSGKYFQNEKTNEIFLDWTQRDQRAFFLLHRLLLKSQADRLGPLENLENSQQLCTSILCNNSDILSKTSYLRFLNI